MNLDQDDSEVVRAFVMAHDAARSSRQVGLYADVQFGQEVLPLPLALAAANRPRMLDAWVDLGGSPDEHYPHVHGPRQHIALAAIHHDAVDAFRWWMDSSDHIAVIDGTTVPIGHHCASSGKHGCFAAWISHPRVQAEGHHHAGHGSLSIGHAAACSDNIGVLDLLLHHGGDRDAIHKPILVANGMPPALTLNHGNTIGHIAAVYGSQRCLERWHQAGGDIHRPNAHGDTIGHLACRFHHPEILAWWTRHGGDMDHRNSQGSSIAMRGVDRCVHPPSDHHAGNHHIQWFGELSVPYRQQDDIPPSSPWINPACLDLCIRSSTHLIDDLHERPVMMKAIRAVARRYGNTYPSLHLARAAVQILSGRMPRSIHGLDTALMHPVLSERADQWASQFRDPIHLASWVTLIDRHRPMRSM